VNLTALSSLKEARAGRCLCHIHSLSKNLQNDLVCVYNNFYKTFNKHATKLKKQQQTAEFDRE